jgi:hypothetical protein
VRYGDSVAVIVLGVLGLPVTLAILPIILLYLLVNLQFVPRITAGAVRG